VDWTDALTTLALALAALLCLFGDALPRSRSATTGVGRPERAGKLEHAS
jgi:hypothetical protein